MAPYRDTNGLKWCTKYVTVEYQYRIKYGLKTDIFTLVRKVCVFCILNNM